MRSHQGNPRFWVSGILALGLLTAGLTVGPHAVAEEPQAAQDLGKDCTKTTDEILAGLLDMGDTNKVTTVRHRGDFNADTPENSLAAFENSYRACRPAIETDIRKTKDGQFVLFHDTNIGKMLESKYNPDIRNQEQEDLYNKPLNSLTYSELREKNLVKIDRTESDQKIINLDTFLTHYVKVKGRSLINLEIKSDSDVLGVIESFDRINKRFIEEGSPINLFDNTIFKFRMTAYPTLDRFQDDLTKINIHPDSVMAMPVMSAQISEQINKLRPFKPGQSNTYTAVDSWSDSPSSAVPSVEIVMKDAQGYKNLEYQFPYYRATDSYLDMIPMTRPAPASLQNTREGTMAEMSELVKSRKKPLAQFVPIPDWAMWRKQINWDTSLLNTVPGAPNISPREAYFNNDSKCCYALSDRLAGDKNDREKADQRILLPLQEDIKATVLTADDTDSIDSYFKAKGKYLDLGDNRIKPNKPDPAMNSLLYPESRVPRAAVAQTTNKISGIGMIENRLGLCLNNQGGDVSQGNHVIGWDCDNSDQMNQWNFNQRDADGYGTINLKGTDYCLNSQGDTSITADIWKCSDDKNAMWRFRSDGSIVDKATKGCLTMMGKKKGEEGPAVNTEKYNGSKGQQWTTKTAENTFTNSPYVWKFLQPKGSTACVAAYDQTSATQDIWLGECLDDSSRRWYAPVLSAAGGLYNVSLQSDMKTSDPDVYVCARSPVPAEVKGNPCTYRDSGEYQWYFSPEGYIVNVNTGGCLDAVRTSVKLSTPACPTTGSGTRIWEWK